MKTINLEGVIDEAELMNQLYRRAMKRVYKFNLMLVGTTGIGKSTLVRSLFQGKMKPAEIEEESKLNVYSDLLESNGVKLDLTCVETSNFDRHDPYQYAMYIDERHEKYLNDLRKMAQWKIQDTRIHCCLYMIPPYGKRKLKKEDLDCMKALHDKVNLVPIIAKADTIAPDELSAFKQNILSELEANGIEYCNFKHADTFGDEERLKIVQTEAERFPFAVVATDGPVAGNVDLWIRKTAAGDIDIFDELKSDSHALARLLVQHCMLFLMDSTHKIHYANYMYKSKSKK